MKYNIFMKLKVLAAGAIAAVLAISCSGCSKGYRIQIFSMGTDATLAVGKSSKKNFSALALNVESLLSDAENSLSISVKDSCIYKFNAAGAGEVVELDECAYDVLTLAKNMYEYTDGYYNPAVYYSTVAYGFDNYSWLNGAVKQKEDLPQQWELDLYRQISQRFSDIEIFEEDGKYYAKKPDCTAYIADETLTFIADETLTLKIDLGGIAKGWCADKVSEMFADGGVVYGYFNFGSSSMTVNRYKKKTEEYTIKVRDPKSNDESFCSFKLKNSRFSTSGDYERSYTLDGVTYCHIINPLTAAPITTGISSVTVVGGSAAIDDALTTALSAMGKNRAVEFINSKLSDKKVIMLLFEGDRGKIITNCPDEIEVLNNDYEIVNTVKNGRIVLS